jgi:uncharacterized iron-regulated membrane protein
MLSTSSLKRWLFVHKWTSLICTVFLLMLCITGLPLIFTHEIEHALGDHPEPLDLPTGTARTSLDTIVAMAEAASPDAVVQFVSTDPDEANLWYVGMGETADAVEVSVFYTLDARTADILDTWTPNDDKTLMDIIFRLHYDMFAGLPGTLFLGAMGLLFVVALVSGVVVYAPFMQKLRFGTVRKHKANRAKWLDLHNLLGIATALWLLVGRRDRRDQHAGHPDLRPVATDGIGRHDTPVPERRRHWRVQFCGASRRRRAGARARHGIELPVLPGQ